jgi:di/tricarboxylate transporter
VTLDQGLVLALVAAMIAAFLSGRFRHDIVALAALIAAVALGLVPAAGAFAGFGSPVVITVACVLILSRGLQDSGAVDALTRRVLPAGGGPVATLAALTVLAAVLSAGMNNVGALALLMPVALQAAARVGWPPGRMLMPLAFASLLGGMTTLIGTPPNLIVSSIREEATGAPFAMFDFAPVGAAVALAGLAFIIAAGWRLVPARERAGVEGFEAAAYLAEAQVPAGSPAVGRSLREIEETLAAAEAQLLGVVRDEIRLRAPGAALRIRAGDILAIEAEPEGLRAALAALGAKLAADRPAGAEDGETELVELVVTPASALIGRSARAIRLRRRYRINLLALSREGRRSIRRLRDARIEPGDVLLVQGAPEAISDFAADLGCLPLAARALRLPEPGRAARAAAVFLAAVLAAGLGLAPPAIAFAAGVLGAVMAGVVRPRGLYDAVDWSVIVLLACLLPVADAIGSTGAADLVAGALLAPVAALPPTVAPVLALALILALTMTLSDLMNNAATVAVAAPIALGVAESLGARPDAFLMAVAIGGSCAFLTPIGHQNNTLILGPGGFRFGDYWRLGLPLEIVVLAVATPALVLVWGL